MKKSTKINKFIILIVVLLVSALSVFAQKPKAKPTPKPKAKTTQTKPTTVVKTAETEKETDFAAMFSLEGSFDDKAKAEEFFKKGQAFWKNLDIQEAINAFTEAIKLYPNYVAALGERGTINFMINKPELALPDFIAVLKLEPKNTKFLCLRGQTLTNIALKIKENQIDFKPAGENAQKALADFNQALEIEPKNSTYYSYRGYLLLEFDFQKEAIADFKKAIELNPKNDYAYRYLGYAKFLSDDGMGVTELGKAIELSPQNAESYFIRGKIQSSLGLLDEALKDFNQAIALSRYNSEYYNARGMVYFRKQDGNAAVKDFSKAIDEHRDFGTAYFNRAMTYKKFPYSVSTVDKMDPWLKIPMQRRKMMEDFSSAIKFKPNMVDAYIQRGLMLSTSMEIKIDGKLDPETINELNTALADFQQAVKIDPKSADAYNGRASCYDQLGKKDLALADYNKAIELDPELATAYMGRMAIYCEMGKKELSIIDEKKIKALGFAAINVCNLGK